VLGQCFITDKNEDFNRPKIVLINRENKTLVIDIEVLLTHNLLNAEAEKVTKYENLTLGIKNIWKLNSLYTFSLGTSVEGVVTQNFPIYLGNIGFTNNMLRVGAKNHTLTNMSQ